jgi:hypothetical protein
MSPTVLRLRGLRFYFYAAEEPRCHVHVRGSSGKAKFWMEPLVELAQNHGLSRRELRLAQRLIQENEHVIRKAWEEVHGNG